MEFAVGKYTTPLYRATFGPLAQVGAYYFDFLTILQGWHPNEAEAMALFREDERVRILKDVNSWVDLEEIQDPKGDHSRLDQIRYQVRHEGIQSLYWNPFSER